MADLIDRVGLLKHEVESDRLRGVFLVVPKEFILDALTIDAVPAVHARWEKKVYREETKYREEISGFHCSNCGGGNSDFLPKYCSNCGARMDADALERSGKDVNVTNKDAPERAGKGEA